MPVNARRTAPALRTVSESPNWRDDAACLLADPDLFFPIGTTGPAVRQVDAAKQICHGCAVRMPCLAWAVDHAVAGVWGGTTEEERRALGRDLLRRAGGRARRGSG